jgi:YHS domain-containing protein
MTMAERREIAPNEDPVCGMTPDVEQARAKGLATVYEGREYVFCGKGCLLEFGDDPEKYLDPAYVPEM